MFYLMLLLFTIFGIHAKYYDTFYGRCDITETLLIDVIESSAIQRLKYVNQYGVDQYVVKQAAYTRYDHSIGVLYILRRFGASVVEQVVGCCHDATHTVFSHVGDVLFRKLAPHDSYQDVFFEEIMARHGMNNVLAPYKLTLQDINPHNGIFTMLEQELPDICADRLEYNLQGGYLAGLLTRAEVDDILNTLQFEEGKWYFTSLPEAILFAKVPLQLSVTMWQSPQGMLIDQLAAHLLEYALQHDIVSLDEIHKAHDQVIWDRLCNCEDTPIKHIMDDLNFYNYRYRPGNVDDFDFCFKGKFRGIDPLVRVDGKLMRLTTISEEFANEFAATKSLLEKGWFLKRYR